MRIFVSCSSSENIPKKYVEECEQYLKGLLAENDLVFGAFNGGLMGKAYEIAKNSKSNITGICPKSYEGDLKYIDCDEEIVTSTVQGRTDNLIREADAIVIMPGGFGTLHELFAAMDLKRVGEIDKPLIIFNAGSFYDKLLQFIDVIYKEKFANLDDYYAYHVSYSIEDTERYLEEYTYESQKKKTLHL